MAAVQYTFNVESYFLNANAPIHGFNFWMETNPIKPNQGLYVNKNYLYIGDSGIFNIKVKEALFLARFPFWRFEDSRCIRRRARSAAPETKDQEVMQSVDRSRDRMTKGPIS